MAGEAERRVWTNQDTATPSGLEPEAAGIPVDEPAPLRWAARSLAGAMLLLAIGWIVALAWAIAATAPAGAVTPLRLAAWIGLGSGPLALLAILALLAFRTGAIDANEFTRRARMLRRESDRLVQLMALMNRRIDAARSDLASHGAELASAGEAAGERLGSAAQMLRTEADAFALSAALIDDATTAARTDLGVLLADLPDVEARAGGLSERLRDVGETASGHAETLAARLLAIEAHARAADQESVGAAARLAVELERIEAGAGAADRRIADVVARLDNSSTTALTGAATALEDIRTGLADQSMALGAMLTQAKVSFSQSGDDASRGLAREFDALDRRLLAMNAGLREQEGAARGTLGQLDQAIGALEQRFAALGDTGAEQTADLAEAIVALSEHSEQIGRTLGQGAQTADILLARAQALRTAVESSGVQIGEAIPAALGRLRLHADQGLQAITATGAQAEKLLGDAALVSERLRENTVLIETQEAALDRMGMGGEQRLAALAAQLAGIATATERTEAELRTLAEGASPMLADALARLRDAAAEAGAQVRAELASAIPETAEILAQTAAREVTEAMAGVGRTELLQVGVASAQAVEAARGASERLTRQLMAIAETTQALEVRIADHGAAAEAADETSFARQAGLLIEALNSTAIDVAKLFSNEPTDTAWAAYLKGDRGIFTRRAVRLLDGGDARTIVQRYGDDPEFHGQVDRYVHDFEALLRRVLAVSAGEAMAVALLSSDMGKLYVALAQAIERLRR